MAKKVTEKEIKKVNGGCECGRDHTVNPHILEAYETANILCRIETTMVIDLPREYRESVRLSLFAYAKELFTTETTVGECMELLRQRFKVLKRELEL